MSDDEAAEQCAADRDLVELLRQRLDAAQEGCFLAHGDKIPGLLDTLDALVADTETHRGHPAVLAVARALVGVDTGQDNSADIPGPETAERDEQWCAFWQHHDPNACPERALGAAWRLACDTREDAAAAATEVQGGGRIARRTVWRTRWQVVDTEGGE